MSLKDLLALSGVPGLSTAVTILTSTQQNLENVKLYRQQCQDLSARCVNLLLAIQSGNEDLVGTRASELADEFEPILIRINRKVKEWADWGQLKGFLQQREIKDGIDRLHRDIDGAMMKFNVSMNMELSRGHHESKAIQERDKAEIREVLQTIVKSTVDMRALLSMQSPKPVEEIMESLQTELMDPEIPPKQEKSFREGLWMLHEKTSKLPPLTDLTGQVTIQNKHTVAKGTFNDIFLGQWLDKEPVALRLPRTLANNPDVQKRFKREVTIWRDLDHPNVVPLYGITYVGEDLYSVSPWMEHGMAIGYVQKFPQVNRLKLLAEIASGLEYLHGRGIVHGDLRGANILISKDGDARLSDFGLSKFLEDCGKGMTSSQNVNPRWFAPELIRQTAPVSKQSDIWSYGMVCLELLTGEQPFGNIPRDITVMREIDNGKTPDHPGPISTQRGLTNDMWNMMRKCWSKKPETRPSIQQIIVKLAEIRGEASPDGRPQPQKRRSLFSLSGPRPSTSGSESSGKSSNSIRLKMSFLADGRIQEHEETSPVSATNSRIFHTPPVRGRQDSKSTENGLYGIHQETRTPISTNAIYNTSRIDGSQAPRLEVPHLSVSAPTRTSSYMPPPFRKQSSDSYSISIAAPVRSIFSTDSGIHLSGPLKEAVTDPHSIVYTNSAGAVFAGTLEGLVERLINNFNLRRDMEYRDIMLTACIDFTTPEDLFGILSRRFHEVEQSTTQHPEDRVAVQYNIFMVIMYWISSRHLPVDSQLLWQMRTFCESAIRMKTASTMVDKARDLLQLIDDRPRQDALNSPLALSPGRKMLTASDIAPRDLALALTLLEGDKYRRIMPSDYIAHLRRHSGYNNVESASSVNNKIILWVKQSMLHYDAVESRADVLKFFINTAQECRKLRNYHSLVAIATALNSAPIERLKLTIAELSPGMKRKLDDIVNFPSPTSSHREYREALKQPIDAESRDYCIPWIAIHLKELHLVLQQNPTVVEVEHRPLINFQRYIKFMDRIKEVLHYKPPDLERYRQQGQLAYLEHQLGDVKLSPYADDELMERSIALEVGETRDYVHRKRELRSLGFKTTSARVP